MAEAEDSGSFPKFNATTNTDISSLPLEILEKTFSYLQLVDRFHAKHVSQRFQLAMTRIPPSMDIIRFLFCPDDGTVVAKFSGFNITVNLPDINSENVPEINSNLCRRFSRFLQLFCANVTGVFICGKEKRHDVPLLDFYLDQPRYIVCRAFLDLFHQCNNLRSFSLQKVCLPYGTINVFNADDENLGSKLETFCLNDVMIFATRAEYEQFAANRPQFKRLAYHQAPAEMISAICGTGSLDELHVVGHSSQIIRNGQLDERFLFALNSTGSVTMVLRVPVRDHIVPVTYAMLAICQFQNITKLEINLREKGSDTETMSLLQTIKYLKRCLIELKISAFESSKDYTILNDGSFRCLMESAASCRHLKQFYLSRICGGVKDFNPLALIDCLENFAIDGARKLKSDCLRNFITNSSNLRFLSIRNCKMIGGDDLVKVLELLPGLKAFEMHKCGKISDNVAQALVDNRGLQFVSMNGNILFNEDLEEKLENSFYFIGRENKWLKLFKTEKDFKQWLGAENGLMKLFHVCNFCGSYCG